MFEEQRTEQVGTKDRDTTLSVWLDLFRWIAAFAVLLTHVNHRLFASYSTIPHDLRSIPYMMFAVPSSFGAPAVICFFVLSGYLVGGGELRRFRRTGQFNGTRYWVSRLSRLWVTLLPALILTVLLYTLGSHLFAGFETGVYPLDPGLRYDDDLQSLICNALFMQTALCDSYAGNGALWSLFNEAWYYVVWPPVMIALWSARSPAVRTGCLLFSILLLSVLTSIQDIGANIGLYFLIWLVGMMAADRKSPFIRMSPLIGGILLIAYLLTTRLFLQQGVPGTNTIMQFPVDMTMALLFANLIMNMKRMTTLPAPPLQSIHAVLAEFSFTLYCINIPVIEFLIAILAYCGVTHGGMMPIGLKPYILFLGIAAFTMLFAWIAYLLFERHTGTVRNWALAKLTTHAPPKPSRTSA